MGSPGEWRLALFTQMLRLAHVVEADNFDALRYQGIPPNTFVINQHAAYLNFFVENTSALFQARQLLADQDSRSLFDQLILFRLLGHLHVRLPNTWGRGQARSAVPDEWKVSDSDDQTIFGPLSIFTVPVEGGEIWLKCWAANISAYLDRQYYFDRAGTIVKPAAGDHVVDAGGCFGDTALFFAHHVGPSGHVYTFDPMRKHCDIMRESFRFNTELEKRITIFQAGVSDGDQNGTVDTGDRIDPGARIGTGGGIALRTIDSVVADGAVSRVDFIKMDIEGSELAALRGAARAIEKWKPKLAISLYHRFEDFFSIPLYLNGLGLGYRFYLDHYSIHQEETVLYATADGSESASGHPASSAGP